MILPKYPHKRTHTKKPTKKPHDNAQSREISLIWNFSLRSKEGASAPYQVPHLLGPTLEGEAPSMSGFED